MRTKFFYSIFLFAFIGLFACEEAFEPELDSSGKSLMVVDGMINNLPGPYTIKLSRSSNIENPRFIPLSGYLVIIEDDLGNAEFCWESYPGNYLTTNTDFVGEVGRNYRIKILAPNGQKTYESNFERLREPTEIAAIDHKLEFTPDDDLTYDIAGYRFYISTEQAPADTAYFLWQLISTFKYTTDFKIYWRWEGRLIPVFDYDTLHTCYSTDTLPDIFLLNSENLNPPVVSNFPLHYVTTQTRALMERYSLLVKQYSISKESYDFWRVVKDQNTNLGDLYSQQPFQVRGNIFNPANPDEIILGQFMVAGTSGKRIFVDKPGQYAEMRYPKCDDNEGIYDNMRFISAYPPSSYPLYVTRASGGTALPNQWCMDCRQSGGVLEKPIFWIDE